MANQLLLPMCKAPRHGGKDENTPKNEASLVRWHARVTACLCPRCVQEYEISTFKDFCRLQIPDKKYLKYPSYGTRVWARVLTKHRLGSQDQMG